MYQQTADELRRQLEDQIGFLKGSAESYDNGFEGEARRLALSIRVLVHDKKRSKSLLTLLGLKGTPFFSSAHPVVADNKFSHMGLVYMAMAPNGKSKFIPLLDGYTKEAAGHCPFDAWWDEAVVIDVQGNSFSRRQCILSVADQDGGAHVDPHLNEAYAALSRKNALGWLQPSPSGGKAIPDVIFASVRQIAHEVLMTLEPGYSKAKKSMGGALFSNMVLRIDHEPKP